MMMIFRISHLSRIASVSPALTPRGMPEYSCKSSHRRREIPSDKFKLNRSSPNDDIRCDKLRLFQLLLLSLCHKLSDDIFAIFEGFNVAQEVVKEEEKVKKDLTSIIPPKSACHSTQLSTICNPVWPVSLSRSATTRIPRHRIRLQLKHIIRQQQSMAFVVLHRLSSERHSLFIPFRRQNPLLIDTPIHPHSPSS